MLTRQNLAVAVVALITGSMLVKCVHAAIVGEPLLSLPILAAWLGAVAAMTRRARR